MRIRDLIRALARSRRVDELATDCRYAARSLARRPVYAAIAVTSIALAIALNTVMYSVIDALIDPAVNVFHPDEIYRIDYVGDRFHRLPRGAVTSALAAGVRGISGLTGAGPLTDAKGVPQGVVDVTRGARQATHVLASTVRPNFFALLGVRPTLGRTFVASDLDSPTRAVVVSDDIVNRLFVSSESPLGQHIQVNGDAYTIIGVVAHSSTFVSLDGVMTLPSPGQLAFLPLNTARVRPESVAVVTSALAGLAARFAIEGGEATKDTRFTFDRIHVDRVKLLGIHFALIAAVLAVLLVACANLANLQLARGIGRSRELAMRTALGASRARLVRHLLGESMVFAGSGLALGLVLTFWGIHLLSAAIPPEVADYMIQPHVSWRLFIFAAVAALGCAMLVGLVPALKVSRVDPSELLKAGAGTGAHRRNVRLYGTLIIAQIGLSLGLLCGAAAVLRSALRMGSADYLTHAVYGYDPLPLISVRAMAAVSPNETLGDLSAAWVARVRSVPGVADAAFLGLDTVAHHTITVADAAGVQREVPAPHWALAVVSPSYFSTMGLPIVEGRGFVPGDVDPTGIVVDRATADYLWPRENPIGKVMKLGGSRTALPWHRVIGVVGDLIDRKRYEAPLTTLGFAARVIGTTDPLPTGQDRRTGRTFTSVNLLVRASGNAARVAVRLRQTLRNSDLAGFVGVQTYDDMMQISWKRARSAFVAKLFTIFASIALALAAIGIYGIVAHSVAERRREIGVRIALGATARDVLRAMLREGLVLALAGVAAGLFLLRLRLLVWLAGFLEFNELFDAPLFAVMAVTLFAITVASALVPAWHATRIDPVEALRSE